MARIKCNSLKYKELVVFSWNTIILFYVSFVWSVYSIPLTLLADSKMVAWLLSIPSQVHQKSKHPLKQNGFDVAVETASLWFPTLDDFRTTVTQRFTSEFCLPASPSIRTGYESTTFHGECHFSCQFLFRTDFNENFHQLKVYGCKFTFNMLSPLSFLCFRLKIVKISFKSKQFFIQLRKELVRMKLGVCLDVLFFI